MATVTGNEIIVPEIFGELTTEKMNGVIKLSTLADEIGVLKDSKEGDSISFPQFASIGEAELMTKGVPLKAEELNQTSTKKVVKHYGKATTIYDQDNITAIGRFVDNAIYQHSRIYGHAIDKDLADDILENAILKSSTTNGDSITEDELIAGFQLFGDEQDNDEFAGVVVNSRLLPSFYAMDGFISSNKTYINPVNGMIVNGVMGYYRGSIPVLISDLGTYDKTTNECITFIVKHHSLGVMPKRDILTELERLPKLKATDVVSDEFHACGLIDKTGVVILRKTIA